MDWKMSRRMGSLRGLAVVLVVVLVMLSGRPPVPKVAVVHAVRENLTASIFSNGKVEPITPYALRAQLATFVEKILAVEGQAVKSGQLLMTLTASGARADLARAEAAWQRLQNTQQDFTRRPQLEVERATFRVEKARSEVHALEEKVRSAEVTAPIDGTLYSLPVHAHDFVEVGNLLAELADLRRVRVRAFIDEPELGSLGPNQSVEITWDALPNRTWTGRTEVIPKQVVARGTRSVGELICSVDNEKLELLPNINVNVTIHLHERRNALAVPRGAVRIEGLRRFVFVVDEPRLGVERSRLQKREIKVGIASATDYEVLEGLREGEVLALPGDVELRDGLGVRVVRGG